MTEFKPIEWKDRVVDSDGTVVEAGTPLNAENLNRIERGIAELSDLPSEIKTVRENVEQVQLDAAKVNDIIETKGQAGGYAELNENGVVPAHQLPTQQKESRVVPDIAARDNLEAFESLRVLVLDATGDSTVNSGWAEYVHDGSRYIKVAEGEQLDLILRWSDIEDKPTVFTPAAHKHVEADIADLDKYTKDEVDNLIKDHTENTNNPHNVTKSQVGLGNVQNYGIATKETAEVGTNSTTYMTPERTMQLLTKWVTTHAATNTSDGVMTATDKANLTQALTDIVALLAHAASKDNPHNVTKAQIGLGAVNNYAIATQAQAESGTDNTVYMTALRVKNAIDKFVPTKVSGFNNDAGYIASNAAKITVSATAPASPATNDIWIVT